MATIDPRVVPIIDRVIASFLGRSFWRLSAVTRDITADMTEEGVPFPRYSGQSAVSQSSDSPPDSIDAYRVGVLLFARLPAVTATDDQPGRGYQAIHTGCPRSGAYCTYDEAATVNRLMLGHQYTASGPFEYDVSASLTRTGTHVRVFLRQGTNPDPRSASFRVFEFAVKDLTETVAGLHRAGNSAIIPDPVRESGNEALADILTDNPLQLLLFGIAARMWTDGDVPLLPTNRSLDKPYRQNRFTLTAAQRRERDRLLASDLVEAYRYVASLRAAHHTADRAGGV